MDFFYQQSQQSQLKFFIDSVYGFLLYIYKSSIEHECTLFEDIFPYKRYKKFIHIKKSKKNSLGGLIKP